jgi:hypothetical protein
MPISSGAYAKLFIFVLATVVAAGAAVASGDLFGIFLGSLPLLFAAFGLFMTWRSRSISHLRTAGRIISGLFGLILTGSVIFGLRALTEPYGDGATAGFAIGGVALAVMIVTHYLYTRVLDPYETWVSENGLFPARASSDRTSDNAASIVKVENLRSFSVADELLKWSKLHHEGVISAEEYTAAKKRLLT